MLRLEGFCRLFALSLPLLICGAASAQVKVGIIDAQSALRETAEMKKAQADLTAKYKVRDEARMSIQKELDGIQNQLRTLGEKLTAQAQAEYTVQAQRKQRELQRVSEDLQADVDRDQTEILSRTSKRLHEVITKLAQERDLDFVIDAADAIYFKPAIDITKDATAAYDKAYPVN